MELLSEKRCDDCRHTIANHDYLGCTLRNCGCELSGLFLLEYNSKKHSTTDKKEN